MNILFSNNDVAKKCGWPPACVTRSPKGPSTSNLNCEIPAGPLSPGAPDRILASSDAGANAPPPLTLATLLNPPATLPDTTKDTFTIANPPGATTSGKTHTTSCAPPPPTTKPSLHPVTSPPGPALGSGAIPVTPSPAGTTSLTTKLPVLATPPTFSTTTSYLPALPTPDGKTDGTPTSETSHAAAPTTGAPNATPPTPHNKTTQQTTTPTTAHRANPTNRPKNTTITHPP